MKAGESIWFWDTKLGEDWLKEKDYKKPRRGFVEDGEFYSEFLRDEQTKCTLCIRDEVTEVREKLEEVLKLAFKYGLVIWLNYNEGAQKSLTIDKISIERDL